MRRIDIITAAANLIKAFKESGISTVIRNVGFPQERRMNPEDAIAGFYKYQKFYDAFGDAEKKMLSIFSLDGLDSPKILASLLSSEKESVIPVRQYYSRISFALDYLPSIIEMLKQDNLDYSKMSVESKIKKNKTQEILTVILPEGTREISSPERLIKVLESIRTFYSVLATIADVADNDLSVVAIDSGSDKSFDFLGAAQLVSGVKEIIFGLWDRVVFFKEKKLHERLDLIAKSLPILESLQSLEQNGKIGREQCEILRRNIISGAEDFIVAGAIIPELSKNSYNNPRELMAPETKLLVESTEHIVVKSKEDSVDYESDNGEVDVSDELSGEEEELLRKLNAKAKKKGK